MKAFFFDRDGTLNNPVYRYEDKYGKFMDCAPLKVDDFEIVSEAKSIISVVKSKGFIPIVVTNQCDYKEKNIPLSEYDKITQKLCLELGINKEQVFACFHSSTDGCECRKPQPGMILEAAKKYDVNLSESYIIGDSWKDVAAGKSAGLKHTFFIRRKPVKGKIEGNMKEMEKVDLDSKTSIVESISEIDQFLRSSE